jgi:hypothetical protein
LIGGFCIDRPGDEKTVRIQLRANGVYRDMPQVIAQMAHDESTARFEAEWVDGQWKLGSASPMPEARAFPMPSVSV